MKVLIKRSTLVQAVGEVLRQYHAINPERQQIRRYVKDIGKLSDLMYANSEDSGQGYVQVYMQYYLTQQAHTRQLRDQVKKKARLYRRMLANEVGLSLARKIKQFHVDQFGGQSIPSSLSYHLVGVFESVQEVKKVAWSMVKVCDLAREQTQKTVERYFKRHPMRQGIVVRQTQLQPTRPQLGQDRVKR